MPCEPQDPKFTQILPEVLLEYLEGEKASLVLFSSYWQMNQSRNQSGRQRRKMAGTFIFRESPHAPVCSTHTENAARKVSPQYCLAQVVFPRP